MVATRALAILVVLACCAPPPTPKRDGPAIAISKQVWEFDTIRRGEITKTQLTMKNEGTDTLVISLFSTCDCLAVAAEAETLAPGREVSIDVSFEGATIEDRTTKTLFIDSNDSANPRLTFKATGRVLPGRVPHLVALPDPIAFDRSEPSQAYALLTLTNKGEQDLVVKEIICFGCVNSWNEKTLGYGEEALVQIEMLPDWHEARRVEIESNDPIVPVRKIPIIELE